jgi:hypothetical protein
MTKKTTLKIRCCYHLKNFGKELDMGTMDGQGVEGITDRICLACFEIEMRKIRKEKMQSIIKVKLAAEVPGEYGPREYTYFTDEPVNIGDIVLAPVRYSTIKAMVTKLDVPESEIAAFVDKVKTITLIQQPVAPEQPSSTLPVEELISPDLTKPIQFPETSANREGLPFPNLEESEPVPETDISKLPEPLANLTNEERIFQFDYSRISTLETAALEGFRYLRYLGFFGIIPESRLVTACTESKKILAVAVERKIKSNEDLKPATDDLGVISNGKKIIQEFRSLLLAPLKSKVDTINAVFKDILAPLEAADEITRKKIKDFREEQNAKIAAAARITEEKERLAAEEAALNEGEITVDTKPVQGPAVVPDHTRTQMATQGFMKIPKWSVEDLTKVPIQYLMVDAAKVSKDVKASKGTIVISGIKIWIEETVRVDSKFGK